MNFFGLGPIEVLVILVVVLLVVGPEKLPELGALVGRFVLDFRRLSDEVKGAFNEALVEPRPSWNGVSADRSLGVAGTVSFQSSGGSSEGEDIAPSLPLSEADADSKGDEPPAQAPDGSVERR